MVCVYKTQKTPPEDDRTGPRTTRGTAAGNRLECQIAAVRAALSDMGEATPEQVARQFKRARAASVKPLLESLSALGQARLIEDGRFAA